MEGPNIWGHPNIQGMHPSIWGHPNVWGHMDTSLDWQSMLSSYCVCTGGIQTYVASQPMGTVQAYREVYRGIQTCRGHPNIWGCPNIQGGIWGIQTYRGHPNIWVIQMYGAYGHPLSLTKHAFFVLCMYREHPNHFLYSPELYLPSWFLASCFFLILNILSIFQNIYRPIWLAFCAQVTQTYFCKT